MKHITYLQYIFRIADFRYDLHREFRRVREGAARMAATGPAISVAPVETLHGRALARYRAGSLFGAQGDEKTNP